MGGIVPRVYANCPRQDRDDGGIRVREGDRCVHGTMAVNGTECRVGTAEGNEIVAPRGARLSVWLRRLCANSVYLSGVILSPVMRQDRPLFLGVSVRLGWRRRFCRGRWINVGGQFMLRSSKEDGRGSRRRSVLAGNAGGGSMPMAGLRRRDHDGDRGNLSGQPGDGGNEGSWSSPLTQWNDRPRKDGGVQRHPPSRSLRFGTSTSPRPGGTAFCALAGSNMEMWQWQVDGHMGRWTNDELGRHPAEHFDMRSSRDDWGTGSV
jgi:hypothetical protein